MEGDTLQAASAWSTALGGRPVSLVRNVALARALLLQAAGLQPGEPIAVPANATRALIEAIKHHGARPHFLDLDANLTWQAPPSGLAGTRFAWAQPVGGLPTLTPLPGLTLWADYGDSLPAPVVGRRTTPATIGLWGLHLSPNPADAGALLALTDVTDPVGRTLWATMTGLLGPEVQPDPARALAQCRRLIGRGDAPGLASRQAAALAETWRGLREAAGLPLLPIADSDALVQHVAVGIPDECDTATFFAYVQGEHTPVRWLPLVRPPHYAAVSGVAPAARATATAANLARWLLIPVGPDDDEPAISQAVLGIVKASEYLGMRWRTDPARAAEYADFVTSLYGADHDAYRPAFPLTT